MPPGAGFGQGRRGGQRNFEKPKMTRATIKRLLAYMLRYKALLPLVVLCVAVSSLSGVASSYIIRPAINDFIVPLIGSQNPNFTNFLFMLARMFAVFLLGVVATWGNSRLSLYISTQVLYQIRVDLFNHLETLPIKFYDSHPHGEIMSRFTNDVDSLRNMMSSTLSQILSSIFTVAGVFCMMIFLSPILTAILCVCVFLTVLISIHIGKLSALAFRENQKNLGIVNGFVEEIVEGQHVVKVFNHEAESISQFDKLNDELRKVGTRAHTFASILMPIMGNMSHIQYAVIAICGAGMVISGRMDLGAIAAFLQYTRTFSQPITQMSQEFNSILSSLAGAERIFAIMDEPSEIDEGAETFEKNEGDIVFENVSFGYTEEKIILQNINIHATPGKKIALVGSTGSGKTTAINLLTRFYDVPHGNGKILFDNVPVNSIKKSALRSSMGMVLQDTHLFTGTISDNIRFGKLNATDDEVKSAARLANADSFIKKLPQGYDTIISNDGGNLSQGQRQLLAIARAAVANPSVLILDEATSSIDTRTEMLIQQGLDKLMEGRTVFVIAHRLSTVRNADEIIVLEHGKIIERGNHDELMAKGGRYCKLYTGTGA